MASASSAPKSLRRRSSARSLRGKPSILHCIIDPRAISVGKDFAPAVKA
ncbi:hypothetical protein ACVWZ3_006662 [Bradyrhizobium sp. i1.3.6]